MQSASAAAHSASSSPNNLPLNLNWSYESSGELFGRQRENKLLQEALHRRTHTTNAKPELILISGGSGSGKTSLAKNMKATIEKGGGYFVMGKFDQLKRPEPYAPLVAAMTDFLMLVLERGPAVAAATKKSILQALQNESTYDISVLTSILPALQNILGPNHHRENKGYPPSSSTGSIDSVSYQPKTSLQTSNKDPQKRQKAIFSKFVRACCSIQRPLVLVMDDLQWSDSGCLELLETLASDTLCHGLALIGICRSNEVSLTHDFAVVLRRLEDERNTTITNIEVGSLVLEATNILVSKVLLSSKEKCRFVANTIHNKTGGNIFHILELLKAMSQANVLKTNPDNTHEWLWDDDVWTSELDVTNDVVDLVIRQVEKLPRVCQTLLSTAACLGAELDEFLLLRAMDGESPQQVHKALRLCVSNGMITKEPGVSSHFRFKHDRVQQASYYLIPEKEKSRFHVTLGRKFIQNLTDFELSSYVFLVVDQMIRGVENITDEDEKVKVTVLCLQAGQNAVLSSDFRTALKYFELGESLLDKRRKWVDHYHLVLTLYNAKAETFCCIADFENMEKCVDSIFMNARSFDDKLRGYHLRISALGSLGNLREAILLGLEVLERLGEPTIKQHLLNLVAKLVTVKRMLWRKTDLDILNLPDITDPIKLSAMGILNMLFTYCYISDQKLFPFIALRMVYISLKYGVSAISCMAFASYGILLCAIGDFDEANRFGQLSIKLLAKRYKPVQREWLPRCYIIHHGMIAHWKQASRSTFEYLEQAHQVGLASGDIEYAWISHYLYGTHRFIVGDPLTTLEVVYRDVVSQMRVYKQEIWAELSQLNHEAFLILMGEKDDPIVLNGALRNLNKGSTKLKAIQNVSNMNFDLYFCHACTNSMIAHYHLGELDVALAMAKGSQNAATVVPAAQLVLLQSFYDGLTAVTILRTKGKSLSFVTRRKLVSRTRGALKMHKYAMKHCRDNFYPRVSLLEAELAAWKGNLDLALAKYELAEQLACRGDHLDIQAVAAERVGLTLRQFDRGESQSVRHLERAIAAYSKWGAWAVVARVQALL